MIWCVDIVKWERHSSSVCGSQAASVNTRLPGPGTQEGFKKYLMAECGDILWGFPPQPYHCGLQDAQATQSDWISDQRGIICRLTMSQLAYGRYLHWKIICLPLLLNLVTLTPGWEQNQCGSKRDRIVSVQRRRVDPSITSHGYNLCVYVCGTNF